MEARPSGHQRTTQNSKPKTQNPKPAPAAERRRRGLTVGGSRRRLGDPKEFGPRPAVIGAWDDRRPPGKDPMTELSPLQRDQRKMDVQHLQLLSIFHFVVAGLAVAGIGFLALHYLMMHAFMSNPEMWRNQKSGAVFAPDQFFAIFAWFYVAFGALLVLAAIANLLSGLFLRRRKFRMFSLVVGAINCIQVPVGTVLGVFTIVVLVRDSIRELYEA